VKPYKFIISGGGTGGHIYPAIAIANELKSQYPNAEILFVGAKDRMEMEKVPQAGYPIKGLWISGIHRSNLLKNIALWSYNELHKAIFEFRNAFFAKAMWLKPMLLFRSFRCWDDGAVLFFRFCCWNQTI